MRVQIYWCVPIAADHPLEIRDGGAFGFDTLNSMDFACLNDNCRRLCVDMEVREREQTKNIATGLRSNQVHGLRVCSANTDQNP